MRRFVSTIAVVGLALGLGFGVTACKKEGTMEKAGKAADEAVEKMKDVGTGAAQEAGKAVDEAADAAKKATEDEEK